MSILENVIQQPLYRKKHSTIYERAIGTIIYKHRTMEQINTVQ